MHSESFFGMVFKIRNLLLSSISKVHIPPENLGGCFSKEFRGYMYRAGSRIFRRGRVDPFWGGFWPPTWALFSENVCENERIGSCRGESPVTPPRSAYDVSPESMSSASSLPRLVYILL